MSLLKLRIILVVFLTIPAVFLTFANSGQGQGISVNFLTPQDSKLIKAWSDQDLQKLVKSGVGTSGDIPIQKFFEESAKDLDWKSRSEIDLLTFYGLKPNEVVRLPRFMVVRNAVKLRYFRLSGRVSLEVTIPSEINAPKSALELQSVTKIEFTQKKFVYPGLSLKVRTNPAASRGEKLYTQNCMSCHSVPGAKAITPALLTKEQFGLFSTKHAASKDLNLSPKDFRGLEAYRDALASEKNEVK